ncbi:hypothetical protein ACSSS7_002988 [Eimeria intestinalis]
MTFSKQVAASLPIFLLCLPFHCGSLSWANSASASGAAVGPQHENLHAQALKTLDPQTSILLEGTGAYKEGASYDHDSRRQQAFSANEDQRVQGFMQSVVNPTSNETHEPRVVDQGCIFPSGFQNQAVLWQMFAGSCPLHWQPLGSAAFHMTEGAPSMHPGHVSQAPPWERQFADGRHQASTPLLGELRLHSHAFRLGISDITTVFAEVLDTRGQLYPTHCGSVSLQLWQPGKRDFLDSRKPLVSGLGVQLLKGGRARWHVRIDNFAPPLLVLQAIPRLCTSSVSDGELVLDSHPGSALLLPAVLALEIIVPGREGPASPKKLPKTLNGATQLLAAGDSYVQKPPQSGIVKVELVTEMQGFHECCNQQTRWTQVKLTAFSDQVTLPEAETQNSSITTCTQELPSATGCKPPTLVYELLEPAVTVESPVFVYSLRLSHMPSMPVNVSIFPLLESSRNAQGVDKRQHLDYLVGDNDALAKNGHLQLFVGEDNYTPGTNIKLEPEEWNKPIIAAVKLSAALATAAAAEVLAGGAPLLVNVKHTLLADAYGVQEGATFPNMAFARASITRTVSVHCTVHTYVDDVLLAESHKQVGGSPAARPISVRCQIQPDSEVEGEIRIRVSAGSSIRLLSPKPGSDLVLVREESVVEGSSGSLVSRTRKEGKEDPTQKGLFQNTGGLHSSKRTQAWASAEVDALLFPGESCTDTACTLTFDLGSRDERRGGDLRFYPTGGKVALLPHSSTKDETSPEEESERLRKRFRLSPPWILMEANQVQAELRVLDGFSLLEKVLASCIKASCLTAGGHPIEASVRCVAKESVKQLHATDDIIDLYVTLKPAVSSSCTFLQPGVGELGSTSQILRAECEKCPFGHFCPSPDEDPTPCFSGVIQPSSTPCPIQITLIHQQLSFPCSRQRASVNQGSVPGVDAISAGRRTVGCANLSLLSCADLRTMMLLSIPSGLVSEARCLPCPGGFACESGKMMPCDRFTSYSLIGDLTCNTCPPGHECLEPDQHPTPCRAGEVAVYDYESGGRRCAPRRHPDASSLALLARLRSSNFGSGSTGSASENTDQFCHTHDTDPECPEGGICWAGRFFACPRGTRVSAAATEDTSCINFHEKCEKIAEERGTADEGPQRDAISSAENGYAQDPLELFRTDEAEGRRARASPERVVCPLYSFNRAIYVYCQNSMELMRAAQREYSQPLQPYMLMDILTCDPTIGICEAVRIQP